MLTATPTATASSLPPYLFLWSSQSCRPWEDPSTGNDQPIGEERCVEQSYSVYAARVQTTWSRQNQTASGRHITRTYLKRCIRSRHTRNQVGSNKCLFMVPEQHHVHLKSQNRPQWGHSFHLLVKHPSRTSIMYVESHYEQTQRHKRNVCIHIARVRSVLSWKYIYHQVHWSVIISSTKCWHG